MNKLTEAYIFCVNKCKPLEIFANDLESAKKCMDECMERFQLDLDLEEEIRKLYEEV